MTPLLWIIQRSNSSASSQVLREPQKQWPRWCTFSPTCRRSSQRQFQVVPRNVLENAKGFAIFTVFKAGFLFSARAGSGIVVARLPDGCTPTSQPWTATVNRMLTMRSMVGPQCYRDCGPRGRYTGRRRNDRFPDCPQLPICKRFKSTEYHTYLS